MFYLFDITQADLVTKIRLYLKQLQIIIAYRSQPIDYLIFLVFF